MTFSGERCDVLERINPTYRNDERTADQRHLGPVEREQTHPEAADGTEEAIYDHVIGDNPADPIEHAESSPQIPRNPIPDEATQSCEIKEALS
jgi:hypothetical protein